MKGQWKQPASTVTAFVDKTPRCRRDSDVTAIGTGRRPRHHQHNPRTVVLRGHPWTGHCRKYKRKLLNAAQGGRGLILSLDLQAKVDTDAKKPEINTGTVTSGWAVKEPG